MDAYDVTLLLTSLSAPEDASPTGASSPAAAAALQLIRRGAYAAALVAALEHTLPQELLNTPPESAPEWFAALLAALQVGTQSGGSRQEGQHAATEAARMPLVAAVASLYLFTQSNLTGPAVQLPECPFELLRPGDASPAAGAAEAAFGRDSISPADRWASGQLAESGEELVGRVLYPQYLLLAKAILLDAAGAAQQRRPVWSWWAMRTALLQQRLLSGRSAALRDRLLGLTEDVVAAFAPAGGATDAGGGAATHRVLAATALLEAAAMETAYGHVLPARRYLDKAEQALALTVELAGALGVRTVHQQDAHAQLIVHVAHSPSPADSPPPGPSAGGGSSPDAGVDAATLDASLTGGAASMPDDVKGLRDESDVLLHPKLLEPRGVGAAAPAALLPVEQALLMALCLHARKGTAADGLQPWEVAAYADAVLQQQRGEFLVRAAARLQASRVERGRPRTRERALLRLEGLVEALDAEGGVPVRDRMRYAFSVWFPLRVALRKELGEALVAVGMVGAALPLFESLELWDSLIVCYRLLEKRVAAEQLIRRRLEVSPADPRLWCALGDLTGDEAHYEAAWERSGRPSARAQRSLARSAQRAGAHARAAGRWEAALAINPLHAEGWFSLGWCWMKEREPERAMRALTRSAQMDPENGEAWNNLAAVHMQLGRWREAFAALSEAVRLKRDSWQTWENFAGVAVRVAEWQAAARALAQVLALSQGQRVDQAVLSSLVSEVERSSAVARGDDKGGGGEPSGLKAEANGGAAVAAEGTLPSAADGRADDRAAALAAAIAGLSNGDACPSGGSGRAAGGSEAADRGAATLRKVVGNLMKQLAAVAAGDSAFWAQYARFYQAIGEEGAAAECLLKRVRALQGGAWLREAGGFAAYAGSVEALCRCYLGSGGVREVGQARMLLRSTLKQAEERYAGHDAYAALQRVLEEVEGQPHLQP